VRANFGGDATDDDIRVVIEMLQHRAARGRRRSVPGLDEAPILVAKIVVAVDA
jgi:hypothetical protein